MRAESCELKYARLQELRPEQSERGWPDALKLSWALLAFGNGAGGWRSSARLHSGGEGRWSLKLDNVETHTFLRGLARRDLVSL
jgi:hypothetical protein